jgi:hypothetical protein
MHFAGRFAFAAAFCCCTLLAQDVREIVRRSVQLDQANLAQMKDYTWVANRKEHAFDSSGKVKSEKSEKWETVILYGKVLHHMLERDGRALTASEDRKQKDQFDKAAAKLAQESPAQRQRRLAAEERERQKDREFLLDVADAFDFRIVGEDKIDGHPVWIISATPRPGFVPKHGGDAKALTKVKGKLWIDKAEYQWVRVEAETIATISYGLVLARLNPGAKLVFEQTRVNDHIWLPKRSYVIGSGRLGLLKKLSMDEEITWSNYRKFQVESKMVASQ